MVTTYDVRVWRTEVYHGKKVTTHYVRWTVDGKQFKEPFRNHAQAESFRSDLVSAARKGEAFYLSTGRPVSHHRTDGRTSWYEFACDYVDTKWPRIAATTRRTIAEALTGVTMSMLAGDRGKPDEQLLRAALKCWAFNSARRDGEECPEEIRRALQWTASHTKNVSALSDPGVLRVVLDGLAVRLDGTPRAPNVVSRWRKILNNAVEYATERRLLAVNPLPALRWKQPKSLNVVDRRSVANPAQARALLNAVRCQQPSGPRLVAFYACLYFAGLRPEEAAGLAKPNLDLPEKGWGQLHLERTRPYAGREWTNSGEARDERQLKQRPIGDVRTAPSPPELTALLHDHLERFGTTPDGRLFVGERNHDQLPKLTIIRVWTRARQTVLPTEMAASPLARTPYDLRHAAVSTWLNAGVPATKVAEWAGHSVGVLLKIYAKCLDGEDARFRSKIDDALEFDSE